MPKRPEYRRISITLPVDVLAAADRMAADSDRPRSWVIAEAVRACGAVGGVEGREPPGVGTPVRGAQPTPHQAGPVGLDDQRLSRLTADLALSVEDRVRAAEEMACVDRVGRGAGPEQLISFARYSDYLSWMHRREVPR